MDNFFEYQEYSSTIQEEIIENCMKNSYDVITGDKTIDELVESSDSPYFLWNVISGDIAIIDVLDCMIDYFEDREEYEKCSKLLKLKKDGEIKCRRKVKRISKVRNKGL